MYWGSEKVARVGGGKSLYRSGRRVIGGWWDQSERVLSVRENQNSGIRQLQPFGSESVLRREKRRGEGSGTPNRNNNNCKRISLIHRTASGLAGPRLAPSPASAVCAPS